MDIPSKEPWTDKLLNEIQYMALETIVPITGEPSTQYEISAVNHLRNFGWSLILYLKSKGLIEIKNASL